MVYSQIDQCAREITELLKKHRLSVHKAKIALKKAKLAMQRKSLVLGDAYSDDCLSGIVDRTEP